MKKIIKSNFFLGFITISVISNVAIAEGEIPFGKYYEIGVPYLMVTIILGNIFYHKFF